MTEHTLAHKQGAPRIILWLVCLYVILLPIGTGLAGIVGSISLMNYIAIAIIIVGTFNFLYKGKLKITYYMLPTFLYFLYTMISVLWREELIFNWYVATNMMNGILFVAINAADWTNENIKKIEKCILLSQVIVLIAVGMNISSLFAYRLNITIVSTIGISDFACGLCLIIATGMKLVSTSNKKIIRLCAYTFIILDFGIIIMSGSRGASIMSICMIFTWIFWGKYRMRTKIITIFVIIVAIVAFKIYFIHLLPETVTTRMSLEAIQSTHGSGRFNLWSLALDKFKNSSLGRVIVGYGFDSFTETIGYGSHGGSRDMMAHNVFFQTMIEGGVIGLVLLLWMTISQFKIALKNDDDLMKIALIGLFIAALSIDMQVTRIWGFILAFNCIRQKLCVTKHVAT